METSSNNSKAHEKDLQTTSNGSSNSSSSSSSNGVPLTPKALPRSEPCNSNNATTFIQADTSSFKHVVQMLTGSSETTKQVSSKPVADPSKITIPPIKNGPKKPSFKLYERRNSLKHLKISPLMPGLHSGSNTSFSPRNPEILSPSLLDFPSLVLSPVTPLIPDPFNRSPAGPASELTAVAEEKAIAEKGFYLHPSPRTTPRHAEPRLLPLFPVTSPRVSGSSS